MFFIIFQPPNILSPIPQFILHPPRVLNHLIITFAYSDLKNHKNFSILLFVLLLFFFSRSYDHRDIAQAVTS